MSPDVGFHTFGLTMAENYERDFTPAISIPLAADLIEAAAPRPGEFVVDIACGTGVVTRLAAHRVGPTGRVVGVDLSPEMVQFAASIPVQAEASVEWRVGNAEALPLADDSYDLTLCQLGLMFVGDRSSAIREMRRVLSPGGRVAINVPGPMPPLFEIMGDALGHHIAPELTGFVRSVFSMADPDELEMLLRDNAFRDVTVTSITKTLRLPPPKQFLWQYIRSTPLAIPVAAAEDRRRMQLEDDVVARWQEFVDHGVLEFELPIVTATALK